MYACTLRLSAQIAQDGIADRLVSVAQKRGCHVVVACFPKPVHGLLAPGSKTMKDHVAFQIGNFFFELLDPQTATSRDMGYVHIEDQHHLLLTTHVSRSKSGGH